MLLTAMDAGTIDAVICRAPEFYGPGKTKSLTNSLVFDRIRQGRRPLVPVSARTLRTLIWTPDASRAMALIGNTPDAYGQTWHLPVDPNRLSYAGLIRLAGTVMNRHVRYTTVPRWAFTVGSLISPSIKEAAELLPRYGQDNIFEAGKFTARFPDFPVTPYSKGIAQLLAGAK